MIFFLLIYIFFPLFLKILQPNPSTLLKSKQQKANKRLFLTIYIRGNLILTTNKTIRKTLPPLLGWICIFTVICSLAGYIAYARLPDITARYLAQELKVPVEIGDIDLSWKTITISDLEISNLPRQKLSKAFSANTITAKTPIFHYVKNDIIIEQIEIDTIYLGLEFNSASSTEGNWSVLMSNLQTNKTKNNSPPPSKQQSLLIKELVLTNIQVEVYYDLEKGSIKRLPIIDKIVLQNISSTEGIPSDQILSSVLGQMLKSVFLKENLQNMLKGVLDVPRNELDSILSPLKNIFPGL